MGRSSSTHRGDQEASISSLGQRKTDEEIENDLFDELGMGPSRFGPVVQDCPLEELLAETDAKQAIAFVHLKSRWDVECQSTNKKNPFRDEELFRILAFRSFQVKPAFGMLKTVEPRLFQLTFSAVEEQVRTETLFPCPGLRTTVGDNVLYMRPSRFDPQWTSTRQIINNLVFVMGGMILKDPEHDVAFVADMKEWTTQNFTLEYCKQFMMALQGKLFPAKVDLFLIVNAPPSFAKVWKIMKPMLSTAFREKVHIIQEEDLPKFLARGYQTYLPRELLGGKASSSAIVQDYCRWELGVEKATNPHGFGLKEGKNDASTGTLSTMATSSTKRSSGKAPILGGKKQSSKGNKKGLFRLGAR